MKITKRQLRRIIKEECSKLKRRGLIKESFVDNHGGTPNSEFYAVCLDMGMTMGEARKCSALHSKIELCFAQGMSPARCAQSMSPDDAEYWDDFMGALAESPMNADLLDYCFELEEYMY